MNGDYEFANMREREFAAEHISKVKQTGDHHWRKAQMYTGNGDYIAGFDDGSEREIRN